MSKVTVHIKRVHPDAVIPTYSTDGAAGFDITSVENAVIPVGMSRMIKTGLAVSIPQGYEIQIRSRSGLALKKSLQAHFGTIDEDYRGEIGVILFNHGTRALNVEKGDRIAQGVLSRVPIAEFTEVDELDETERGSGGFGSTGTKGAI